jgi:hypothetical protein
MAVSQVLYSMTGKRQPGGSIQNRGMARCKEAICKSRMSGPNVRGMMRGDHADNQA